jgi:ribonuclease BN (tRNA processing enzyme)
MFSSDQLNDIRTAHEHGVRPEGAPVAKGKQMQLTVVGSGDAFGSGGRSNTCFRLDSGGHTLVIDFGASALVAWNRLGLATGDIDAVAISHLHGDHFGGLPFLLLECQFVSARTKPLTILGPKGLRARLEMASEALFPGMWANRWSYPLTIVEMGPGETKETSGFQVSALEVKHLSGAIATALRVDDGAKVFAYSGDTAWVENLVRISDHADLFIVECYSGDKPIPNHIDWPTLKANLPKLNARHVMVTHMGATALARRDEMAAAGLQIAEDGNILQI